VLGREVRVEGSLQSHQELVWFTYRKNIRITATIHSDVGWGCLIRVAQMAWAHSLQRHFALQERRVDRHYIVTPFLEGEGQEFKYGLYRFM
jgi:cysteine protease ATG4